MIFKKKILAATLAATMVMSNATSIVAFAEEPVVSSGKELIMSALEMAVTGVESQTLEEAKTVVSDNITTSGNEVFYEGNSVGFWYEDTPLKLYSDAEKSSTVISWNNDSYTFAPTLLANLIEDFNANLVDTYAPTTMDWRKIIGKYDVQLGDISLKADQWVPLTPVDSAEDFYLDSSNYFNMSDVYGLPSSWKSTNISSNFPTYGVYMIDNTGKLYVSNVQVSPYNSNYFYIYAQLAGSTSTPSYKHIGSGTYYRGDEIGYLTTKLGLTKTDKGLNPVVAFCNVSSLSLSAGINNKAPDSYYKMLQIGPDPIPYTGDYTDIAQYGIFHYQAVTDVKNFEYRHWDGTSTSSYQTQAKAMSSMFKSQSTSKLQTGNNSLKKRLAKLQQLELADTVTVTAEGWTVNGQDNIDFFMGLNYMGEAGSTSDINAIADVEGMVFRVVIPSTLPIYIDEYNNVTVADNATVNNLSSAAVKIKEVEIMESPDTDWTLVEGSPSAIRDAKEFTFTTTLTDGIVLEKDEVLSFAYDAKISPLTEFTTSLNLAVIRLTVDWADAPDDSTGVVIDPMPTP